MDPTSSSARLPSAQPGNPVDAPSRLARRLGTTDAVVLGLGSMIGAGVFAAIGPAAAAAGNALLVGLAIAAAIAYCNASSSAQLAALHPESGGTYVYGRKRLGPFWGFLAGWSFVVGKLASCAAMAMTFASHASPALARPIAVVAVLGVTALGFFGVHKTALVTRVVVVVVLSSLALVVAAIVLGGQADPSRLWPLHPASTYGVLQSAGLLFFAFAGYARLATLGEEVVDPGRTIPRAISISLGLTLLVYVAVAASALSGLSADSLARSPAPLATAVSAGSMSAIAPVVRFGATVASLGVLMSLVIGISRTIFAMASNADLPRFLAVVHPRYRVPHRAEVVVGLIVAGAVAVADLRLAIGFSSFAVLLYYAVANAAAYSLSPSERRRPRWIAVVGFIGCVVVACTLPVASVVGGVVMIALGAIAYCSSRAARARDSDKRG